MNFNKVGKGNEAQFSQMSKSAKFSKHISALDLIVSEILTF